MTFERELKLSDKTHHVLSCRIGSRNWGMSARSDAEYEEILRDLEEKEVCSFPCIFLFFQPAFYSRIRLAYVHIQTSLEGYLGLLYIHRNTRNTCENWR